MEPITGRAITVRKFLDKWALIGLIISLALALCLAIGASSQASPPTTASAQSAPFSGTASKAKPSRISKISQGMNLKAEPSNTVAPANPLCGPKALQTMVNMRVTGADTVQLVVPLVQQNARSNEVKRRADTPTDDCLRTAIRNAHSIGLKNVDVKPLLEFVDCYPTKFGCKPWRGRAHPSQPAVWMVSWTYWLIHYAGIVKSERARMLVLGTEMLGVTTYLPTPESGMTYDKGNPARWRALPGQIHAAVPGVKLGYAANWGSELENIDQTFLRSLDYPGFTFYLHLKNLKGNPSSAQIRREIKKLYSKDLEKAYKRAGKHPLTVFEYGAPSLSGAYKDTGALPKTGGSVDLKGQQKLIKEYLRFFEAQPKGRLTGINLWTYATNPQSGGEKSRDFTAQNKRSEATLASAYGGTVPQDVAVSPGDGSKLAKDKDFIRLRPYDQKKWPLGSYTGRYRINGNDWKKLKPVKATDPYLLATIRPNTLPTGRHRIEVQMRDKKDKVVADRIVTVTNG